MKTVTLGAWRSCGLAKSRNMRENPFKNELFVLLEQNKGVSLMLDDTVCPQVVPSAPSLKEQMVTFFEQMLTVSDNEEVSPTKRGRGRPASFCLQHLWL